MSVTIQTEPTKIKCKYCGSEAVMKFGTYKGVQRFWCKSCKRKFKADDRLFHMTKPADYISTALADYYSGSSITDIRNKLKQQYDYYPSKSVVFWWVNKYTALAAKQFQDAHPTVGDTWIADETVLELDRGVKVWFFDIIDSDTRYLLSSRASLSRTQRDAQILLDRAIKRAGKQPKVVVTDKLASYLDVNYGKGAEHVQGGPFKFKVTGESTAQIERFHGTIKDRTKVMRAFRDLETLHTFMDGYLTFYNYFKPNEALAGKTPAEAAKVDYTVKNWKDLACLPAPKAEKPQNQKLEVAVTEVGKDKPITLAAHPNVTIRTVKERKPRAPRLSSPRPQITPKAPRITGRIYERGGMLSSHRMGRGSRETNLGGDIVYSRRRGRHVRID